MTRLANENSLIEVGDDYTFFWKGLPVIDLRIHGVGFVIKTNLMNKLPETPTGISEHIMTLRVPFTRERFVTLISCYAPTLSSPEETKDKF